ncbi:hypothetical protein [Oligoflexus tunisiensis]|uniref:hypothetical protein n=1 Tax=Oligoflexus tunisiensis TaxID=708132 RepID=UPI00114CE41C|nr:hypothetical protein [Oligoflexus tunisiensis]
MESEEIFSRMKKLMALGVIAGTSAVGNAEPVKPLIPPSTISTPASGASSIKEVISSIRGGTGSINPIADGNPDFDNFENFDNWQDFDNFENFDNFSNVVGDWLEPGHGGGESPRLPGTGGRPWINPVADPTEFEKPIINPKV